MYELVKYVYSLYLIIQSVLKEYINIKNERRI
jgi:hypothetical protein